MFFVCLYVDDFIYTSNDRVIFFKKKKVCDDRDDMSILESYITISPLKWFNLMLKFLFLKRTAIFYLYVLYFMS